MSFTIIYLLWWTFVDLKNLTLFWKKYLPPFQIYWCFVSLNFKSFKVPKTNWSHCVYTITVVSVYNFFIYYGLTAGIRVWISPTKNLSSRWRYWLDSSQSWKCWGWFGTSCMQSTWKWRGPRVPSKRHTTNTCAGLFKLLYLLNSDFLESSFI